jgi:hypothetical protein
MSGTECRTWWNEHFPESAPVGYLLRQIYPERWLRIHSLPESKRYADTAEEYVELLRRHNEVATDVLGAGSQCYLIEGFWVESDEGGGGWVLTVEGEELPLRLEVTETTWDYGRFDALLREVADWTRANVVFASRESGRIYAPYDGGADLICRDEQERHKFKGAYRAWLSRHPAGL